MKVENFGGKAYKTMSRQIGMDVNAVAKLIKNLIQTIMARV